MRKIGKFLGYLVGLVAMVIVGAVAKTVVNWAAPAPNGGQTTEALLADVVRKSNQNLPKVLDANTRLDSVTAPAPNVLQATYTLLNIDTTRPKGFRSIEKKARSMLIRGACSTAGGVRLLDMGITSVYAYRAADGSFFGSITVTKADCRR